MPTDEVCRRQHQGPASSYKPKAKYEVMTVSDAVPKALGGLESEVEAAACRKR